MPDSELVKIATKIRNDTSDVILLESKNLKSNVEFEILNKAIELVEQESNQDIDEQKDKPLILSFLEEVKSNVISNS